MSRTTRTIPHWVKTNPGFVARHLHARWIDGRDGIHSDIGSPYYKSPHGYDSWDEISGKRTSRQWVKRGASKNRRRNGKQRAFEILKDFELD